jgi:pilus assembly protein CpaF
MLQAMNTGHEGSLSTLHANSPRDAISRLETMVLMAGVDLPARAIREQIASALDLVVQIARLRDGSRRVVGITEVVGMEGDIITLSDIFTFDFEAGMDENGYVGTLQPTGLRPHFSDELLWQGIELSSAVLGGLDPADLSPRRRR